MAEDQVVQTMDQTCPPDAEPEAARPMPVWVETVDPNNLGLCPKCGDGTLVAVISGDGNVWDADVCNACGARWPNRAWKLLDGACQFYASDGPIATPRPHRCIPAGEEGDCVGPGMSFVGVAQGELELCLSIGDRTAHCWISREMWNAFAEAAGWVEAALVSCAPGPDVDEASGNSCANDCDVVRELTERVARLSGHGVLLSRVAQALQVPGEPDMIDGGLILNRCGEWRRLTERERGCPDCDEVLVERARATAAETELATVSGSRADAIADGIEELARADGIIVELRDELVKLRAERDAAMGHAKLLVSTAVGIAVAAAERRFEAGGGGNRP